MPHGCLERSLPWPRGSLFELRAEFAVHTPDGRFRTREIEATEAIGVWAAPRYQAGPRGKACVQNGARGSRKRYSGAQFLRLISQHTAKGIQPSSVHPQSSHLSQWADF